MTMLDADQLGAVLDRTRADLFRWEALPAYDVPVNGNDFERWIGGETEPNWVTKKPWMDTLTRWARDGRPRRRVRYIHDPITLYERYACDWGYRLNEQAGERIRILDAAELGMPSELADYDLDFLAGRRRRRRVDALHAGRSVRRRRAGPR